MRAVDCSMADCLRMREDRECFRIVVCDIIPGDDDDGNLTSYIRTRAFNAAENTLEVGATVIPAGAIRCPYLAVSELKN